MSDDAERWAYRLGAAAPLLVPWLIVPLESARRPVGAATSCGVELGA